MTVKITLQDMPQGAMSIKRQMMVEVNYARVQKTQMSYGQGLEDATMRKEALTWLLKTCAQSILGKRRVMREMRSYLSAVSSATCLARLEILMSPLLKPGTF